MDDDTRKTPPRPGRFAAGLLPGIAIALCAAAAFAVLIVSAGEREPLTPSQTAIASAHTDPGPGNPVRLGLVDFNYSQFNTRDVDATLERVQAALAPRKLIATRYKAEDLDRDVRAGKVDFFLASSGFYWRMIPYGARSLATLVSDAKPDPNRSSGAVFIVRDESPVKTVEDLKGRKLAASYPSAFEGYRISMADLAERGFSFENFFSGVTFTGSPHVHGLMHEIITGKADAAIIPACSWEEMPPEERAKYRLIGAREDTGMRCLSTTRAYPGHTFSVMNGVPPEIAKTVLEALLSMKDDGAAEAWSIATDFTRVDAVYRALKLGPYAYLRETSAKRWVRENKAWILLALLFVAGLAFHAWRSEVLVNRRTRELREEEAARALVASELEGMNQRMERMHKANIVGQLSSMISHELAQPLAAIRYYCEGERDLLQEPAKNAALLSRCNEKVNAQADRAIAIVEKVRSYAKATATREAKVDLCGTVESVLKELRVKGIGKVAVRRTLPPALFAKGDPLEFELLLWNLLKNATEAALLAPLPSIEILAEARDGKARIRIENSGPALSADDLARLSSPLSSSKSGGLGLGVAIVRSIAESSGGGLSFEARPSGGLSASVWLPLWDEAAANS